MVDNRTVANDIAELNSLFTSKTQKIKINI